MVNLSSALTQRSTHTLLSFSPPRQKTALPSYLFLYPLRFLLFSQLSLVNFLPLFFSHFFHFFFSYSSPPRLYPSLPCQVIFGYTFSPSVLLMSAVWKPFCLLFHNQLLSKPFGFHYLQPESLYRLEILSVDHGSPG